MSTVNVFAEAVAVVAGGVTLLSPGCVDAISEGRGQVTDQLDPVRVVVSVRTGVPVGVEPT